MDAKAAKYIEKLQLRKHPEGGYYNEIYRSAEMIYFEQLPERFSGNRNFSTSIYYLLEGNDKSRFHKLNSDEIWHFYDGSSVKIYLLDQFGKLSEIAIGKNIDSGEVLQAVIEKDTWFCAEVNVKNSFALVGCTVAPGFDFDDFIPGNREELSRQYPEFKELITRFT